MLFLILALLVVVSDLIEPDTTPVTDNPSITSVPEIIPTQSASRRQIWAFYLSFWVGEDSWSWQSDVLTDYPLIGRYDSRQRNIAQIQINQAQETGIDAFVVNWFGISDTQTTTITLENMLRVAEEENFKIGVVMDAFNPQFLSNRTMLEQSLQWLNSNAMTSPAYLHYQGQPVVMFAFQENSGLSSADWVSIRDSFDPGRNQLWIAEGLNGCCIHNGAMDAMYAFNMAWGDGAQTAYDTQAIRAISAGADFFIPTIHPGWDESLIAVRDGRTNPTSARNRANGQFLADSFRGAVATGADIILIGTWNEFMENSHIEPGQLYGTNALDTLHPLIANWKSSE